MLRLDLSLDSWGRLVLTDEAGQKHAGVEVVRGFPISSPRRGIALLDPAGRELAWIEDLDAIEPATRQLLEAELPRREFIPNIQRVRHISGLVEPTEWLVETDRGEARFILSSEDDVRRLVGGRAIVIDAHGIRYLIADVDSLDAHSRRLLERYL